MALPPQPWQLSGCVEASIAPGAIHEPDVHSFVLTGAATECEAPWTDSVPTGFGLATVEKPGNPAVVRDWEIRIFPGTKPWEPTTMAFGVGAVRDLPGQYPVCVVEMPGGSSPSPVPARPKPVVCVLVTVTEDGTGVPAATTQPLSTTSPLLGNGIYVPPTYTGNTTPAYVGLGGNCGTCF
ncbi:hypothetical protein L083_4977 [Actinoplanes sp. N902-109]|nr:hypothetical protein L083_4977 [Actinoplanes sp. N902-109]